MRQEDSELNLSANNFVRYRGLDVPYRPRCGVTLGECVSLRVNSGDLVSLRNVEGGGPLYITSLSDSCRNFGCDALDLPDSSPLPESITEGFEFFRLRSILTSRDGSFSSSSFAGVFDSETSPDEIFVFRVTSSTELFFVFPVMGDYLEIGGGGYFEVEVRSSGNDLYRLPAPLGRVVDEWRVSRGTAHAYEVKSGQFIQIIDVEGRQCSDFMAMRSSALDSGLERYIDSTVSRTMSRSSYPRPGLFDKFYDQDITPLLSVRQDTVGRHDTFALACTSRGYEERGFPGHINCSDNISAEYSRYGIGSRPAWPAINFFFNTWIDSGTSSLLTDEAWSRSGDYVLLEALTDLVCVSTACPDDVDPINGWNPTDIHVRVYASDESPSLHRSIMWRSRSDDVGVMTRESPVHSRTSSLTSNFGISRDLWVASHYDSTGAIDEYWSCRRSATVQDMSGLRKYDITGPDSELLLQHCLTRDVSRLSTHRGFYTLVCDERGYVLDDGTLFRLEPDVFRLFCGSDDTALHLREHASRLGYRVWIRSLTERLGCLSVQGPKSREIVSSLTFTQPSRPSVDNLGWFGFTIGRLRDRNGIPFMLSRTGFTGELGYEFFCDSSDAPELWDALTSSDVTPMGSSALEILRIEAGLMMSGSEFGPDIDAFESGLGFAVDFSKSGDFVGRSALERNSASPRRCLVGLIFGGNDCPSSGDGVFLGREQVGVVTSATRSPELGHSIAMARVATENSELGTSLEVGRLDNQMKRLVCRVGSLPFLDSSRKKVRS